MSRAARLRELCLSVVCPFVVTRVWLAMVGYWALAWMPLDQVEAHKAWHFPPAAVPLLNVWQRWDAEWYLTIAAWGYRTPIDAPYDMRPGFFPLLPWLTRVLHWVTGDVLIAGLIVANAAALVFLWVLFLCVERRFDRQAARWAVWAYLAYPAGFFLSTVYTESLLLCCFACAWWFTQGNRPFASGVSLGLAALTRPTGLIAVPGFVWMLIRTPGVGDARLRRALAVAAPVVIALGAYALFAFLAFGNVLDALRVQTDVRGETGWPWLAFQRYWSEGPAWHGWANSSLDAALAVAAVIVIPLVGARLGPGLMLVAAALVLVPLGSGLISFSRMVLAAFPLFVYVGVTLSGTAGRAVVIAVSFVVQSYVFALFATWHWIA